MADEKASGSRPALQERLQSSRAVSPKGLENLLVCNRADDLGAADAAPQDQRDEWAEHDAGIEGSQDIWIAIIGPDTPALGVRGSFTQLSVSYTTFNMKKPPFNDARVRLAVALNTHPHRSRLQNHRPVGQALVVLRDIPA